MPSMKGLRSTRLKPLPFGVVQHPKDATLGFGTGHQLRRGNPIVVEAGVGISSFVFHRILSRVVVAAALFVLGAGFVSPISAAVEFPTLVLSSNLQARVYARSNVVGNVVAMCFDRQGRLLTVDANRRLTGTWGVTMSRWWSMEDYAGKTLKDREGMYARWAHIVPPAKLTRDADPLRRVEDADGDGIPDKATELRRYNDPLDGNAAGVAVRDGSIYVANAPRLYRIGPDGKQEELVEGLGVRVGVYGHDLHGLAWGPDGRLYFSLGDRGFDVVSKEGKRFTAPTRGAVFRCFPDGTGLELFHVGLRNPQDLEFNELGDLFTVDNDMGGVDRSRVVHVVEGGDSGWDASYQLTRNFREETKRKDHTEPPWFTENLWKTRHEGQPAWLHPPVAYLTQGPSGMEFDPGWGLPEEYRNHFFVCDFKGSSPRSGILGFRLETRGAGYGMARTNRFAWGIAPTDIEFGWDGRMYASDWISGWGGNGERRIVTFESKADRSPGTAREVQTLVEADHARLKLPALVRRLGHLDRRVRRLAQDELARRGAAGEVTFRDLLGGGGFLVPRKHALWGLWQIGLRSKLSTGTTDVLGRILADDHPEMRAQAARVIGDLRLQGMASKLMARLKDSSARVRYFAAMGLGKLKAQESSSGLVVLLRSNAGDDVTLQHAGAFALSRVSDSRGLLRLSKDPSASVRLGALLALRHQRSSAISGFLADMETTIANEAIRAIHDLPIKACWAEPLLGGRAFLASRGTKAFPVKQRLLNIQFRQGRAENAKWLAACSLDEELELKVRLEALRCLEKWARPSPFDRVTWHHRPVSEERNLDIGDAIASAVSRHLATNADAKLSEVAARLAVAYDLLSAEQVRELAGRESLSEAARLEFIGKLKAGGRDHESLLQLLKVPSQRLRLAAAARLLSAKNAGAEAMMRLLLTSKRGDIRRDTIRTVAGFDSAFAGSFVSNGVHQARDEAVKATDLDWLEAGLASPDSNVVKMSKAWLQNLKSSTNRLAEFQLTVVGGDSANGKRLFAEHAVQCVRCHVVKGFGGDAGPELTRISRTLKADQIVEALIDPSARIAEGFGTIEFELTDGESVAGFVQSENPDEVRLALMDGRRINLKKNLIRSRSKPVSAMPSMREALTRREIRDLVAYLSSLR